MSEDFPPRLFATDAEVRHLGEGLLACALTRAEWTHEAHLASCVWLLVERPDIVPERDLPAIIRRFNESVGGINDDKQGYHETITQCFIIGARQVLARTDESLPLREKVNALLMMPEGRRVWPLAFYSRERLFSVEARLVFVPPDQAPLPASITEAERYRG
ncbi:hypothetical protein [Sphingosinicella sp. BN140058]|uniref:hypothetical protein n=1 Tax=Sphingosinicella sp. BN140058 TaxID=1892855 RepID=UPI0010131C88|nr:hypothetical protein [Sphingosinicella sp. BN140058]QAY79180.1 hypothetical protein ETR14_23560 [Sphingosinicella sp. BN140058]